MWQTWKCTVLLEALPPTVHHHLSTHTHNHMAAEERKESGAAHPASTHQSSIVKPICWDKAAKETLLRRVEEQRRETVFKITTNYAKKKKVAWIETMNDFLVFTTKSKKTIRFECIMCVYASKCIKILPLWDTRGSMSGANHSTHSEVKHDGYQTTKLRTIKTKTQNEQWSTNHKVFNMALFYFILFKWNPKGETHFLRAISWDSRDHFHTIRFCLYSTWACSHSRNCAVFLKNTSTSTWEMFQPSVCEVRQWRSAVVVKGG